VINDRKVFFMLRSAILLLLLVLVGCAAGTVDVKEEKPQIDMTNSLNRLGYAAGYQLGDMFQNQKLALSAEAVLLGMNDARKNIRTVMTKAEMKMILRDPKKYLVEQSQASDQDHLKEGQAFLKANGLRDGVVVLESGLQYLVLREGQGAAPTATGQVRLNYTGKSIAGNVFVSTANDGKPKQVPLQTLMPGMSEALQLMKEGAKWELYIPSELAYANHGPLANQTLIFDVELVEVLPAAQ